MSTLHVPTRDIAKVFLTSPYSLVRYHYYYARSKLATDPVYAATLDALRGSHAPVLDLGCGIGLLLHALRADGQAMPYFGVDLDPGKIAKAELGLENSRIRDARFAVRDIGKEPTAHRGTVAILDVLQYLDREGQQALLAQCASMLGDDGMLVIRSGLREDTARSRITRIADFFAHRAGWMVAAPKHFPTREGFEQTLQGLGLQVEMRPLHGKLGLNNWLILARPG